MSTAATTRVAQAVRHHLHAIMAITASIALVAALFWILHDLDLQSEFVEFMTRIEQAGRAGMLVYFLVVAASVLVLIPNVAFTLGAGYLYGVAYGSILIVLAEVSGALAAFLIARYCFGETAGKFLRSRKSFSRISFALLSHRWQLIALMCLLPVYPFKLSCYLFGLSTVRLRDFMQGIFIGIWPMTLFNTYLGSLSADLMSIGSTTGPQSTLRLLISVAGFTIVAGAFVLLSAHARRKIHDIHSDDAGTADSGKTT